MYSKIAIENVKKSFKDYTIYFLTLTLAVCIFYSFNSIEAQKAFMDMKASDAVYMKGLIQIISYVSVFVSAILGCLILYANNFLIKKRKKELGVYMTLGMGKSKISRILIGETIIVGAISLVSGILLGIGVSQGLSLLTAKLFEVPMNDYSFVISLGSMGKTILYFGIMFFLVMIFNTFVISKYEIIDLLTSGRKNEDIKFKNPIVYFIAFILCVSLLGIAYKIVLEIGLRIDNPSFKVSILFGILGTVLFFFSLTGFILFVLKRSKKVYFEGLNIFVVKQLNSKVNTNFMSMSLMCLMLFLTISILSTGFSFKQSLEAGLKDSTPFDVSGSMFIYGDDQIQSIEQSFKNIDFKIDDNEKIVYYNIYESDVDEKDMLSKNISNESLKTLNKFSNRNLHMIKLSDYNNIRKLDNKKVVTLGNHEVLMLSNVDSYIPIVNDFLSNNDSIEIHGQKYIIKNNEAIEEAINTDAIKANFLTVVVNDEVTNGMPVISSNFNGNFEENDKEKSNEKFANLFNSFKDSAYSYDEAGFILGATREQVYAQNKGMTTSILFVGIYLGVVFLITSMAVLALQQLSEASDSIDRYKVLKKIGATDKMIRKTIFIQILTYFSLPIGLAFIHSMVGIKVANSFIELYNKSDIGPSAMFTAFIFIIVYGGYFFATYSGYKNIVKTNL